MALLGTVAPAANAAEPVNDSAQVRATFVDWYSQYGVGERVALRLADKFLRGVKNDAERTDTTPLTKETSRVGDYVKIISRFKDGSVSEVSLEQPLPNSVSTRAIGNCSSTPGDTFHREFINCAVSGSSPYLDMQFRATYVLQKGYDYIEEVASPYAAANVGTVDGKPSLRITRKTENASPATAVQTAQYNGKTTSFTATLTLRVGSDTATSSKSGGW